SAGDLEAPAHAAGEGHHLPVAALPEADHAEHLLHPRFDDLRFDPVELGVEAQVLLGAEVAVEGLVLEDEADVAAHVVAGGGDVEAGDLGRPVARLGQRAEHVDRRRLAGAVGAEEAEDLAGLDLEVHAFDGFEIAEAFAEVFDGDGCHSGEKSPAGALSPGGTLPCTPYGSTTVQCTDET